MDLGAHQASRGDFSGAMRSAEKAKIHCVDAHHTLTVTALLLEWACMAKDWNTVLRNVDRGELHACTIEGCVPCHVCVC